MARLRNESTRKKKRRDERDPLAYSVRPAVIADVAGVSKMRAKLWPDGSREEHADELRRILSGEAMSSLPFTVLVAESTDGELIGFADVGLRSHADSCNPLHPVGYLEGWFVRRRARRSGVGSALLTAGEVWSRAQGCKEMASDTWADHPASVRAHQALGFEITGYCVTFRKDL